MYTLLLSYYYSAYGWLSKTEPKPHGFVVVWYTSIISSHIASTIAQPRHENNKNQKPKMINVI